MIRFPTVAAFVIGGLVGATLGFAVAVQKFANQGQVAEFKILQKNLAADPPPQPQLREYLKARLYYVAMGLTPQDVAGQKIDYGPVEPQVLGRIDPRQETVAWDQLYQDVLTRYGLERKP
jgi:hypothetical protein